MDSLDCLIIGYNDDTNEVFNNYLNNNDYKIENRIHMRNHLVINNKNMTYMDVINYFVEKNGNKGYFYHVGEVSNLAGLYLESYLYKHGFTSKSISLFQPEKERIRNMILSKDIRTVAITTTFYEDINPVNEICKYLLSIKSDIKIIVGGPLVYNLSKNGSQHIEDALKITGASIFIEDAQGEDTLVRVISAIKNYSDLHNIPNIYVRDKKEIYFTGRVTEKNNINDTTIEWDLFDTEQIGASAQLRTARSCAYSCSFCDYPIRAGKLSTMDVSLVEKEITTLVNRGVKNIIFIDDTFNVPEKRFQEICKMIIKNRFDIKWFSYFRCSSVNEDITFDLMKESGCTAVFLGIESGDPDILINMHKAATIDKYIHGMYRLNQLQIHTFASFIAGFPGETEKTINNTIDFINTTNPTFYRMEPWWYNHQSPIHNYVDKFGLKGQGYNWSHKTMNVHQACDMIDIVFESVQKSLWCPQQSFSFWAIPYLLGKGMNMNNIVKFHEICHKIMKYKNDIKKHTFEADMEKLIETIEFDRPRYYMDK